MPKTVMSKAKTAVAAEVLNLFMDMMIWYHQDSSSAEFKYGVARIEDGVDAIIDAIAERVAEKVLTARQQG